MTLEAEPVSPGEALSGKLSGKFFLVCDRLYNSRRLSGHLINR